VLEQTLVLGRSMQGRVAGLNLGLMAIKPDEADPEAVVGVSNPETSLPEQHRVRPGDRFDVAGRRFQVRSISQAGYGRVELTVSWDGLE